MRKILAAAALATVTAGAIFGLETPAGATVTPIGNIAVSEIVGHCGVNQYTTWASASVTGGSPNVVYTVSAGGSSGSIVTNGSGAGSTTLTNVATAKSTVSVKFAVNGTSYYTTFNTVCPTATGQ